jgi:hypothetical protein
MWKRLAIARGVQKTGQTMDSLENAVKRPLFDEVVRDVHSG